MAKDTYTVYFLILAFVLTEGVPLNNELLLNENSAIEPGFDEEFEGVRMKRSISAHLACYETLTSFLENFLNEEKEASQTCVNNGKKQEQIPLSTLNDMGSEISAEVKRIQDSLEACAKMPKGLHYFECLKDVVEDDKRIAEGISTRSMKYTNKINEIQINEHDCLIKIVDSAKNKVDQAFATLKNCLATGYPTTTPRFPPPPPPPYYQ